jgi:NADPH-dependent 2,4-dienoyl-CoA reductase/sulfur reductase-like enzyme
LVNTGWEATGVIVVVGAGLAGLHTVRALREQGYAGRLTLLGAEDVPPYDRPPLTKEVLRGDADHSTLEADWDALDVDLRLGVRALSIADGLLATDADEVPFEQCVLATGAVPKRLPGAGVTLRTHADAMNLRAALVPGARLVIVGAGWIGAEVSTAALAAGAQVTVLEAQATPLANAMPPEVVERMLPWWSGVDLRTGVSVAAVEPDAVHLGNGTRVEADLVLVAVGARPTVVDGVELEPRGAVAVDSRLRTSVPGVWAVGDCAAWESERYATRLLVEHWDAALHAPTTVAANVLGGDEVWDPVPYFWSEQWGRMVQYAGHHPAADRTVWREGGDTWAVFWLAGGRLVAALSVDRPRDLVQARRLMERSAVVDDALLADPAVAVKSAAVAGP